MTPLSVGDRSVVLVTIDSLRADYCGHHGGPELTPAIDSMASDGIEFTNAVAPGPSTSESTPAIFTGSYPIQRQTDDVTFDDRVSRIRPHMQARQTLAEQFKAHGYRTAAFTPNPFTSRYFGFDAGFDHFVDFLDSSRQPLYERLLDSPVGQSIYMPTRVLVNAIKREEVFKSWNSFYDDILEWINDGEEPYFLWVFLMDAHHPYLAGPANRTQSLWKTLYANWRLRYQGYDPPLGERTHEWLVNAYREAVRHTDQFIEQLQADLDDPVFVVTSDHGESFGEHGTYEHHGGALGQHGAQEQNIYMYEENLHVPLVVGNVNGNERISRPFSLRGLPSLFDLDAAGLTIDPSTTAPYAISRTFDGSQRAIRGRDWKCIDSGTTRTLHTPTENDREFEHPDLQDVCSQIFQLHEQTLTEAAEIATSVGTLSDTNRI